MKQCKNIYGIVVCKKKKLGVEIHHKFLRWRMVELTVIKFYTLSWIIVIREKRVKTKGCSL